MNKLYSVMSVGHDNDKLILSIELAITSASENNVRIVIFVPAKNDLQSSELGNIFEASFIKGLLNNKESSINNIPVTLISSKNPPLSINGVLLTLWTTEKMIIQLNEYLNLKTLNAVVIQSSNPIDIEQWCKTNNVINT